MHVLVSWSGGKDSTAAMLLHRIFTDNMVSAVCYIPMLTDDIPLISKNHFEFILKTADYFRAWGDTVHIVFGMSYYDHVHRIKTRGKNVGFPVGYGLGFGFCLFRDCSKIPAIQSVQNSVPHDFIDIGIAVDEFNRKKQLTEYKRSILCEMGYTEKDAFELCYDNGLLSPKYLTASRDGCAICPNASANELRRYCADYPKAIDVLREIDEFSQMYYPQRFPFREHLTFSERLRGAWDTQYSLGVW